LTNDSAYITANNAGIAKAWVNFNGTTGTTVAGEFRCTIRSAHNVSKVVRSTTGDYSVYFNAAFADANYCAIMSSGLPYQVVPHAETYGASAFRFKNNYIVNNNGNTLQDSVNFSVVIFR
jgi:precorrin-4 methylase